MKLLLPTRYWYLTGIGWLWLLIGAGMTTLGIAKNINLVTLLGMTMLALLLLNAVTVGRGLKRLRGHRHLEDLLFAHTTSAVEVRLHATAAAPSGVRIEDDQLAWFLDRAGRVTCRGDARLPGRGWHLRPALTASSGYPFGLVRRVVELEPERRILVLPLPTKIDRERIRQQLRGADPRGERVRRRGWRHEGAQADFHGLRPFRPGDSPRWIHWRTSARRGELMVREFEDVPGDDVVLVLAPGGDLEASISLAAGVCFEWCRRRGDRLALLVGDTLLDDRTGPEHARALLECLAALPTDHLPEPNLAELFELPATLAVVVVTAGLTDLPGVLETRLGRRVTLLRDDSPA